MKTTHFDLEITTERVQDFYNMGIQAENASPFGKSGRTVDAAAISTSPNSFNSTQHRLALQRERSPDVQKVKVIVQQRLGKLNQLINENRMRRIKAAQKIQKQKDQDNEIENLIANLGGENDATKGLRLMMEALQDSLERQYTKDDLFKLKTIDDSIIAFITYVRKTQLWFDKKLDTYELETLFSWLDSEHKPIIEGLQ